MAYFTREALFARPPRPGGRPRIRAAPRPGSWKRVATTSRMIPMAGLIRREDIDRVRGEARIDEVVSQYVNLKPAGMDSLKGLCPFHDEKTPSFHVRPNHGRFHCFGCGEDGDVIAFVQKIENIGFVEAVELLARKFGIELHYEDGGPERKPGEPSKRRLIDAHRVAQQFFQRHYETDAPEEAREVLTKRGFEADAMDKFGVGYSPDSWDALITELRRNGFSDKEIVTAGLATQGNRGLYDRFRGRLMWPIYSITGEPIGFGARKIDDAADGPKYLNTPETPIYHKSHVLYGLNVAKREISKQKQIVIVEGYTDVMAAHLAGITTAVATCGTAFGEGHVKIVRRLLGDSANPAAGISLSSGGSYGGEVIFTFDGDAAGKKAALRAFEEDQAFAAQTFVAISPNGLDPCEVRQNLGDEALRGVIASRRPLFEFAIRTIIDAMPLATAEGRTAALRAAAPIVAGIRDRVLRGEYTRNLAGWLGMEEIPVTQAVAQAARHPLPQRQLLAGEEAEAGAPPARAALAPRETITDMTERVEREALNIYLQLPAFAREAEMDSLPSQTFVVPTHRRVHEAIRAAGGTQMWADRKNELIANQVDEAQAERAANAAYIEAVCEQAGETLAPVVSQLATEKLLETDAQRLPNYVWGITLSLIRQGIVRQIGDVRSALQRADPQDGARDQLFARLMELEAQRRACDERQL